MTSGTHEGQSYADPRQKAGASIDDMYSVSRGEGTPLLFLHGFLLDHRSLLPFDEHFAAEGRWRRVYVDLPGMGRTPAGPEIDSTDAVAEAVSRFIRAEFGGEPFAVVGNSFGGMIARSIAAEFGAQVIGLALLCPVFVAEHARRDVSEFLVAEEEPGLLDSLPPEDAAEFAAAAVVRTAATWKLFRTAELPGIRAADPDATARIAARYELSRSPEAAPITVPTTIITGRHDDVVGYRDALRQLENYPRATFAVLDRAGHTAHLDQPEMVAALLSEWSRRLP